MEYSVWKVNHVAKDWDLTNGACTNHQCEIIRPYCSLFYRQTNYNFTPAIPILTLMALELTNNSTCNFFTGWLLSKNWHEWTLRVWVDEGCLEPHLTEILTFENQSINNCGKCWFSCICLIEKHREKTVLPKSLCGMTSLCLCHDSARYTM